MCSMDVPCAATWTFWSRCDMMGWHVRVVCGKMCTLMCQHYTTEYVLFSAIWGAEIGSLLSTDAQGLCCARVWVLARCFRGDMCRLWKD